MITVRDVLDRPAFRGADVAAGQGGLDRPVHWVHVGEIPNLSQFLKGHELVLTTGVGLTDQNLRTQFLMGLIESQAAGLVVELGQYWTGVPEDLLGLAETSDFPIIAFRQPVRFLDLSREIDALVISRHHQVLDDLESLSLNIRQALLNTDGPFRLMELLYQSIDQPVLYRPRESPESAIQLGVWDQEPPLARDVALNPTQGPHYIQQTIMVFGAPFADLYVSHGPAAFDERVYLAVDRTCAALAQDVIRIESLDRARRREESALMSHLLFEESPEPTLCQRFRSRYRLTRQSAYRVMAVEPAAPRLRERLLPHLPPGFSLASYHESDRTILVAAGPKRLVLSLKPALPEFDGAILGMSGPYDDPATMHRALSEAEDAQTVASLLNRSFACYDQIGIWRWILYTPAQHLMRLVVEPELGSLLQRSDADRLINTLGAVLAHQDSKLAASQSLGIHRQTLYSRLAVLKEILGSDFLEPHRRLALEAALLAHHYLKQSEQEGFSASFDQ